MPVVRVPAVREGSSGGADPQVRFQEGEVDFHPRKIQREPGEDPEVFAFIPFLLITSLFPHKTF